MLCSCYLRKDTVYIPTWARVERGSYRMVEPVSVTPVSDTEALRHALHDAFARGNPTVPYLPRAQHPPPVLPKYTGVKDWNAFVRGTATWSIDETNGAYAINRKKKSVQGEWIRDPDQTVTMPPGSTIDDLIDRMIAILQEAARKQPAGKTARGKNAPDQDGRKN